MTAHTSIQHIIIGALTLLAAILLYFSFIYHHSSLEDIKIITAAENGIVWLQHYPADFKDPGIAWVLSEIHSYCPDNDELMRDVEDAFKPFIHKRFESAYVRLLDPELGTPVSEALLIGRHMYYDDILIPALYCNERLPSEETITRIIEMTTQGGYHSTHAYLALTLLQKNNCISPEAETVRQATAQLLAQEQDVSTQRGDLYAERIAFLLYGDHTYLVQDKWIENIVNDISPEGGWSTIQGSEFFGTTDNPHTTALATWALVQHQNTCPLDI